MKLSEILSKRNKVLENIEYYKEQLQIVKSSLEFEEQELRILDSVDLYRGNKDGVMPPSVGFIPLHPEKPETLTYEDDGVVYPSDLDQKHQEVYNKHFPKVSMEILSKLDKVEPYGAVCALCESTGKVISGNGLLVDCPSCDPLFYSDGGIVSGDLPDSVASQVSIIDVPKKRGDYGFHY